MLTVLQKERKTFLDHILANREDDVCRLVYADWLDENYEALGKDLSHRPVTFQIRADFIRKQIRYNNLVCDRAPSCVRVVGTIVSKGELLCDSCREKWDLLFPEDGKGLWVGSGVPTECVSLYDPAEYLPGMSRYAQVERPFHSNAYSDYADALARACPTYPTYRRGFVDRVDCELAYWHRYGKLLAKKHPVTTVVPIDRKPDYIQMFMPPMLSPYYGSRPYVPPENWYCWRTYSPHSSFPDNQPDPSDPSHVTRGIFDIMMNSKKQTAYRSPYLVLYKTLNEAYDDLKSAMLQWALAPE
jgi:uncharacterized protein (TIGR02996 family)